MNSPSWSMAIPDSFSGEALLKWGALVLVLVAVLRKNRLTRRRIKSLSSPTPLADDFSDEDDVSSSCSSEEDDDQSLDFRVKGFTRTFSWEGFHGASVVKLWDGGLVVGGFSGGSVAGVSTWDRRTRCRTPAIHGEWRLSPAEVSAALLREPEVYLRGGISGEVTVGDVRKFGAPVGRMEDSGEVWWDAGSGFDAAFADGGSNVRRRRVVNDVIRPRGKTLE